MRALEPDDLDAEYVSWWNDPVIQARLGLAPRGWGIEQARAHVNRFDTHTSLPLGIFDRANGRLIGFHAIHSNPRTRVASTNRGIGNKSYWRRGVSRELSAWSIPFIFSEMDRVKITSTIHGENRGSMWLVEHLGFRREGVLRQELRGPDGGRLDVYKNGLLRDEWRRMVEDGAAPWGRPEA